MAIKILGQDDRQKNTAKVFHPQGLNILMVKNGLKTRRGKLKKTKRENKSKLRKLKDAIILAREEIFEWEQF